MIARRYTLAVSLATLTLPSAAQQVIPLWPTGAPEPAQVTETASSRPDTNPRYPGVALDSLANVTVPTLTIYPVPPGVKATGAAAVVFPGGGYQHLAWQLEGVMPCRWFNARGIFCVAVKYRVPWPTRFPDAYGPLEDAQQAVRIVRAHATEWHFNKNHVGIMGFSAGGHLSVTLSQHFDDPHVFSTPAAKEVDASISARPDFCILVYPAYLSVPYMNKTNVPDMSVPLTLDPNLTPNSRTPPTFLVQAENDVHYVDSSLAYYRALKNVGVPAEMILYPDGGHGFGMHPQGVSSEHWADLAAEWLRNLKMTY